MFLIKKRTKLFISILAFFVFLTSVSFANAYVSVDGYYRNDGTYVEPYVRSEPNGVRYDNYGYDGGDLYNDSYNDPSYSSDWNSPSWDTDPNYYQGESLYESNSVDYYDSYDYDSYDYDYDSGWDSYDYSSYGDYDYDSYDY
jgi:hypothetical protein